MPQPLSRKCDVAEYLRGLVRSQGYATTAPGYNDDRNSFVAVIGKRPYRIAVAVPQDKSVPVVDVTPEELKVSLDVQKVSAADGALPEKSIDEQIEKLSEDPSKEELDALLNLPDLPAEAVAQLQ